MTQRVVVRLIVLMLLLGVGLPASAQEPTATPDGDGPAMQPNVTAEVASGRIFVSFDQDPNTEWVQVFIGTPEWHAMHTQWYPVTDAECDGERCVLLLDLYLMNGAYVAYIQPWGGDQYAEGGLEGWFGPGRFVVEMNPPAPVENLGLTMTTDDKLVLTWQGSADALWHQVWLGTVDPLQAVQQSWYEAAALGCLNGGVCSLTLDPPLEPGVLYSWYVISWGSGGFSATELDGWVAGPDFSLTTTGVLPITPDPETFGFGGQVDWFEYPYHMERAGMWWVKKQFSYSIGRNPEDLRWFIDKARQHGMKPLISVVGNKDQLANNRQQFIAGYSNFLAQVALMLGENGAIEVWNEPNIEREWPAGQISGASYTEVLAWSYVAIKQANPRIMVISAAPAPTGTSIARTVVPDDVYIRQMAAAGAADYMDCVGVHYNEGAVPPDATSGDRRGNPNHYTRYFPAMTNLYSSVFPGKPLCYTELGYVTGDGLGQLPPNFAWANHITLGHQAAWLAQVAQMSAADPRIRLLIVWNIDFKRYDYDPMAGFAIVRPGGGCHACDALAGVRLR